MHRFYLIVFLAFTLASARSQNVKPPILSVSEYKDGIYRSFSEFLRNAPSITDRFTYTTNSDIKQIEKGEGVYRLILIDSAFRRRDMKKFWGFSDGKNIFVNELPISGHFVFRKIQQVGRYCLLMANPPNQGMMSGLYPAEALVASAIVDAAKGNEPYVLNINNGKFFLINKATLMTILEKDKVLAQEYREAEKQRNDQTLSTFIRRYNETHADEANADAWFERELIIFRRQSRELAENFEVVVNDTLVLTMKPNTVHRLKLEGETVKICAGTDCKNVALFRKGINYVGSSLKKPGSGPSLWKADLDEGEARVEEILKESPTQ